MDSLNWVESHHAAPQAPPVVNTHDKKLKISWVLTAAFVAVAAAIARAVFFTPLELKQGAAQKIFYIHVPAAWVAFLAFALVAIASAVFLWLRDTRLDRFAESSAEVGVVFTTVVLITGPLWANLFATLHPLPIVAKASKPSLPGEMLLTLFISLAAFTLLYIAFVHARYKYAVERERITAAREAHA